MKRHEPVEGRSHLMSEKNPSWRTLDHIVLPLLNGLRAVPHTLFGARAPEVASAATSGEEASVMSVESLLAHRLLARRRQRDELLGKHLAGEHFWDLLLRLFIVCEEGKQLRLSELCGLAPAPPDAVLRWLSALTAHGHVVQRRDPDDPAVFQLSLAPLMAERMRRLLASWRTEDAQ